MSSCWSNIEKEIFAQDRFYKSYHRDFRGARVYLTSKYVYKIQINDPVYLKQRFYQSLLNEYEILKELHMVKGVIKIHSFNTDNKKSVLKLDRIKGTPLCDVKIKNKLYLTKVILSLIKIVFSLSCRKIIHGDLAIHNFFVTDEGDVFVLDFGSAQKSTLIKCFQLNFLNRSKVNGQDTFPVSGAIIRVFEFSLPEKFREKYRKVLGLKSYKPNLD